jgi:CelD/BcsL family acetyltransferase involved in cellulose biosynthesis
MLTIRCITDERAFNTIGSQWNSLLQQSKSDSFCLTWEWIQTWWETFGESFQLLVLTAEDEHGKLYGIAPLMVSRGKDPITHHIRTLMFIGQEVDVTPEYLDFIALPGHEAEIMAAFSDYLIKYQRDAWDIIRPERVLDSSVCLPHFIASMRTHGVEITRQQEVICRYVALDTSWDEYLKNKTQHFRKRWNNTRNRLYREGEIDYQFVPHDVSLKEAYDKLIELNRERWGEDGASFRSEKYIQFHRRLCERIESQGWLLLVLMTLNGRVIAAKYDYLYAGKIWGNQGGWSREYQQKKVGEVFIGKLLEWGIEKQVGEYDFLGGDAEYKDRWGTGQRMMADFLAYNTTWRGQTLQWAQRGKLWLKDNLPPEVLDKLKDAKKFIKL